MARCSLLLLLACQDPVGSRPPIGGAPSGTPAPTDTGTTIPQEPRNVLIVLADDLGVDKVRSYQPALDDLPRQPTLDRLARDGVRFETAYASPVCSPARAMLLTGRYPHQTGLGAIVEDPGAVGLSFDELALPELVAQASVPLATAAFGKWHLVPLFDPEAALHPTRTGFDVFAGTVSNLNLQSYYDHQMLVDGEVVRNTTYATTRTVDDALAWATATPEPWLAYVAFHAPHTPLEAPPAPLLAEPLPADASEVQIHAAMLEAMDTELGRLLDGLAPEVLARTTVIFLGDNGTFSGVITPPFDPDRAKLSAYEGGVRVPFLVMGPDVGRAGAVSDARVTLVDVFPTVAELVGLDPSEVAGGPRPGISLLPLLRDPDATGGHDHLFAESFHGPPGPPWDRAQWTVRDDRWKLYGLDDGDDSSVALYDLSRSPFTEGPAVFTPEDDEQQAAWDALLAARDAIRSP